MKITILFALLLLAAGLALANPVTPEKPKPVDTYGDHQQHCYNKCTHYKTLKGKCVDFEWVGTKKECCQWKTVGKGKCKEFKKISKCVKYSKKEKICLGHGYKQFCSKVTKEKLCAKYEWKEVCKKHGKNHGCDKYAYHFICTKYDQSSRCAVETYVPKISYFYKKRCARYAVDQYCAKYKTISKTIQKWVPVEGKHYKGWVDRYFHQVLEKKHRKICVVYAKRKRCVKHQNVKFSKKVGYQKKCVKFITSKFCVAKKKIQFCTKFVPNQFCAFREKVRVCKAFRTQKFCCDYKAKPFCTQYKTLQPRCVKKKFKKICVKKSPGFKVCAKFQFVGGKKVCRKFADKSVCAKKKKICTKIDTYKPKKPDTYKPKKPDTYKPKPDTYKPKRPDTYKP